MNKKITNQNNIKNNEGLIKSLCYVGIFILLIFIICPPLFRVILPEEEQSNVEKEEEKKEKQTRKLNCNKTEDFAEYKLKTTIDSIYVDEKISKSIFTYEVQLNNEEFIGDEIVIDEYEKLKRINNIDFNEDENKYILKINYELFDYTKETLLLNHQGKITDQISYYTSNNFECKTNIIK